MNLCLTNGANDYPMKSTYYFYNALGKMSRVQQGGQNRYFLYDSFGRLIRIRQPEQEVNSSLNTTESVNGNTQWSAGFTYDVFGNIKRATDANGVNIINEYDKANRVTTRCYTPPNVQTSATTCARLSIDPNTPTVDFYYDGKGLLSEQTPKNFGKGKLTKVTSSVSETRYVLFDNLGRLTQSQQITDGQTYTSGYEYNLSGALVKETYPSGRVVQNEFESDGDLRRIYGKANTNATERTYANGFSYTAAGGISQLKLGNGRWETAKYNDRLQLIELGLGNSSADSSLWKVNYEYGELQSNGTVEGGKNTGNLAKQTITIPNTNFVQTYKYDSLYRLIEAKEKTGTNQNWVQNLAYDRFGNRTEFEQTVGQTVNTQTPTIDGNTNRFSANQGFGYDKNGNVTSDIDPFASRSRSFTFNGENKQTAVKNASGVTIGRYFYDGEGKRVKKETATETTIFVYSSGKLVGEYSTQTAQSPTISYTTTDHLGSPRVITDALGQVKSRRDFMPFGEDLFAGVGARNTNLKYGTSQDDIRQKFTGYQKDKETELDFAEARMYENRYGRFTAVDPLLASGKSADPQSFNRYVYVGNNPLNKIDPTGLVDWFSQYNAQTGMTTHRWSDDNQTFADGTSVNGWTHEEFGFRAEIAVDMACYNADCTQRRTAYLRRGGVVEWAGDFIRIWHDEFEDGKWIDELRRDWTWNNAKKDWNQFWEDPLGEKALGNPGLAFVTGGMSSEFSASKGFRFFAAAEETAETTNTFVNLATLERTTHILEGEGIKGGHAWFASIRSFTNGLFGKKSMFPARWGQDKIMNAIGEVATNPKNKWIQQTGVQGAKFTQSGLPVKYAVDGVYEGVRIRVITTQAEIITAFPVK